MSHTSISHVIHLNESRDTYKLVGLCVEGVDLSALSHSTHAHTHIYSCPQVAVFREWKGSNDDA